MPLSSPLLNCTEVFARQRGNPLLYQPSPCTNALQRAILLHLSHPNSKMASSNLTQDILDDVNSIAAFLAHNQVPSLKTCDPVDCIIICASSVLYQASYVFQALEDRPSLAKVLVLVGGIGHSTNLIYDAVARHPEYHELKDKTAGLPEANVLHWILTSFFDLSRLEHGGLKIFVENRSTNCGANAVETRKVLDKHGVTGPLNCIVVQDPTMSLRTVASFEKACEDLPAAERPRFKACPTFVPKTRIEDGQLEYVVDVKNGLRDELRLRPDDLWEKKRLCELLVGEVARLKDDENGYGPKGKGFIGHVDVPNNVVQAAQRVKEVFGTDR